MSTPYKSKIEEVIEEEKKYIRLRRKKANKENKSLSPYFLKNQKENKDLVGLAFSGGGIRSASFNLGVVQALSKFGILSWVDYLSTVSGGGFTGATLISLLGWKKDKKSENGPADYHFNTQWEQFPFNPNKKIIKDQVEDIKDDLPRTNIGEYVALEDSMVNQQLRHLVEKGNFLTPRNGYVTRDVIRFIGHLVGGTSSSIFVYLLLIFVIALGFYTVNSAMPEYAMYSEDKNRVCIFQTTVSDTGGFQNNSASCTLEYTNQMDEQELWKVILFNAPVETVKIKDTFNGVLQEDEDIAPSHGYDKSYYWVDKFYDWLSNLPTDLLKSVSCEILCSPLTFLNYDNPKDIVIYEVYVPLIAAGIFVTILIMGSIYIIYRPLNSENVKPRYAYSNVKTKLKRIGWVWISLSSLLSIWIGLNYFKTLLVDDRYRNEVIIWPGFVFLIFLVSLYYWFCKINDKDIHRLEVNSSEKDTIFDNLIIGFFIIIYFWIILLAFGWTRIHMVNLVFSEGLNAYVFFKPLAFTIGAFFGLLFVRMFIVLPGKEPIFRSAFRSAYSSWIAVNIYTFIFFSGCALLMVAQLFITPSSTAESIIPLSSALISGIWATIMLYLRSLSENKSSSRFKNLFTLPEGIWQGLFAILVLILNFSLLFIALSLIVNLEIFKPTAHNISTAVCFFALVFLFLFLTWAIDPNEISPHYFFRDRIDDAFLRTETSSKIGKRVIARDDSELSMQDINPDNCSAPYHLVVGTINLSGSWKLGYKDRKSAHFLFSRHHIGSEATGYVKSCVYRRGDTKYSRALAISGAAFASSLGVYSFLAASFLLTVLNIRLGIWMTHPKYYKDLGFDTNTHDPVDIYEKHNLLWKLKHLGSYWKNFLSPIWLKYIWDEARNRVSERRDLINISDGGHTGDNAAIYPLLQRRCKLIFAGDASADPQSNCVDLYRVIRMARVDLGIDIRINTDPLKPNSETGLSEKHVVVGEIKYPQSDQHPMETGWLVYIKPTITESDRGEIKQYYETNKNWYPHPSTGDQWFDEWQFEAQRLLGEEAVKVFLDDCLNKGNKNNHLKLSSKNLYKRIFGKDHGANKTFSKAIDRLFAKLYDEK